MRGRHLAAMAALMLAGAGSAVGGAVNLALPSGFGYGGPREPASRGFRKGRRFDHRGRPVDRNGHRPAGSKLANKAARGTLTIVGIR